MKKLVGVVVGVAMMSCTHAEHVHKETERHEHSSHHGGQIGMAGEFHLEVAVSPAGLYRVWPTDDWRNPVPLDGVGGEVTVTPATGESFVLPLTLSPDKDVLIATGNPIRGVFMVEVSVAGVDVKPISMEFQFTLGDEHPATAPAQDKPTG